MVSRDQRVELGDLGLPQWFVDNPLQIPDLLAVLLPIRFRQKHDLSIDPELVERRIQKRRSAATQRCHLLHTHQFAGDKSLMKIKVRCNSRYWCLSGCGCFVVGIFRRVFLGRA